MTESLNLFITKGKEYEFFNHINNLIEAKTSGNKENIDH